MRHLSKDSIGYQWFDNTLTAELDWWLWAPVPKTDCGMFWWGLWNGLNYVWMTVSVLFAPLTFMAMFVSLFTFGLESWYGIGPGAIHWFSNGLRLIFQDMDSTQVILFAFPVMVIPTVLGAVMACVLLVCVPIAAVMCAVGYTHEYLSGNKGANVVGGMIKDRAMGIKGNFCTPIVWDEKSDEKSVEKS